MYKNCQGKYHIELVSPAVSKGPPFLLEQIFRLKAGLQTDQIHYSHVLYTKLLDILLQCVGLRCKVLCR